MTVIEMILSLSTEEQHAIATGPHSKWSHDDNCWMPEDEELALVEMIAKDKILAMNERCNYANRDNYYSDFYDEVGRAITYFRKGGEDDVCTECPVSFNCYRECSDDCYYCTNCDLYDPVDWSFDEDEKEVK